MVDTHYGGTMKHYYLLQCYPCGGMSGNRCLGEIDARSFKAALDHFQTVSPVPLDEQGYAKCGDFSYVVGESL